MYDKIKFGNKLSVARRKKGLKQSVIAGLLGIHQTTYSKIENGKGEVTLTHLYILSNTLGVSVSWLIGETDTDVTADELLQIELYKQYIISIRGK
ncbi:MAG: Helix-turn-helix domain [Herbinix sp.]|jgi:transcriptional regulator with XRE-family HTH domain|nr:Helix-turn-helix domain [Herbinix sp.]